MTAWTVDQRARVLRALVGYCEDHVDTQVGWTNNRGYSCDETGCGICNASEEAAEDWLGAFEAGNVYDFPWSDEEVQEIADGLWADETD